MHAIQISRRCSDPRRCGRTVSCLESWLDSANRSSLASMVANRAHHRGCLDVGPKILTSARLPTERMDFGRADGTDSRGLGLTYA